MNQLGARAKYFTYNTMVCLLKAMEGKRRVTVELRDNITVTGHLEFCESSMNLTLANAVFTDMFGNKTSFDRCMVKSRQIVYVQIPDEVDIIAAMKVELNRKEYFQAEQKKMQANIFNRKQKMRERNQQRFERADRGGRGGGRGGQHPQQNFTISRGPYGTNAPVERVPHGERFERAPQREYDREERGPQRGGYDRNGGGHQKRCNREERGPEMRHDRGDRAFQHSSQGQGRVYNLEESLPREFRGSEKHLGREENASQKMYGRDNYKQSAQKSSMREERTPQWENFERRRERDERAPQGDFVERRGERDERAAQGGFVERRRERAPQGDFVERRRERGERAPQGDFVQRRRERDDRAPQWNPPRDASFSSRGNRIQPTSRERPLYVDNEREQGSSRRVRQRREKSQRSSSPEIVISD